MSMMTALVSMLVVIIATHSNVYLLGGYVDRTSVVFTTTSMPNCFNSNASAMPTTDNT